MLQSIVVDLQQISKIIIKSKMPLFGHCVWLKVDIYIYIYKIYLEYIYRNQCDHRMMILSNTPKTQN